MRNLKIFFFTIISLMGHESFAATGISYHGRLLSPNGESVKTNTQFKIQIRTPGNENCLMYEEVVTRDLSQTDGVFSITIADGTGTRTDSTGFSIDKIFANRAKFTFSSNCDIVSDYTPNPTDGRRLKVSFNDGSFSGWEELPAQVIGFAPIAIESLQVGGYRAVNLMRVEDGSGTPQSISALTSANFTELMNLIMGTSANYMKSSPPAVDVAGQVKANEFCLGTNCITAWPSGGGGGSGTVTAVSSTNSYLTVTNGNTTPVLTVNVGAAAGTVAAGDDSRFTDSRAPAGTASGDLGGSYPSPSVIKLRGNPIATGTISAADVGQVYRWDGSNLVATYLNFGDLRTSTGTQQLPPSCATNEKLQWSTITDAFTCELIGLNANAITAGTIDPARLPASASLWQEGGSGKIYYSAGNVGVGTASPLEKLHVQGKTFIANDPSTYPWAQRLGYYDLFVNDMNGDQRNTVNNITYASNITLRNESSDDTSRHIYGLNINVLPQVADGKSNGGKAVGAYVASMRNNLTGTTQDSGTLNTILGLEIDYGHNNMTAKTPVTTHAYGLYVKPFHRTGAMTDAYDIFLAAPNTGGTVTDHFGIYQADPSTKNYYAGNVGFGTTTPAQLLHAYKSTGTASLVVEGSSTANANSSVNLLTFGDGSKTLNNAATRGWDISARGAANAVASEREDLLFAYFNGTTRNPVFAMDSATFNVGVGTQDPAQKLDVAGNVKASGYCIGTDCINAWPTGSGSTYWQDGGSGKIYYSGGKVGIGTMSPSNNLEIRTANGMNADTYLLRISGDDGIGGAANTFDIGFCEDTLTGGIAATCFDHKDSIAGASGQYIFQGSTSSNNIGFIDGKVGIGTTSPIYKLDVKGDVNVTGNFKINGVNIAAGAGTVTSVSSVNTDISVANGSTTPMLTLNSGSGANQILKLDGSGKIPSSTLPASVLTPSSADLSDGSSLIKSSQMPANCTANQTLTFSSPTGTWTCSTIAITGTAFGSQAVGTVFAAPTSAAGNPTFRNLASTDLPASGVTAGTYKSVTVDDRGRVTAGTNPTTAAGYGITDAFINGGNTLGAGASLGTNDANLLSFRTNSTDRMTVASNGHVGIGTTAPYTLFDVVRSGTTAMDASMPVIRSMNSSTALGDGTTTYNQAAVRTEAANGAVIGSMMSTYQSGGTYPTGVYLRSVSNHVLGFATNNAVRAVIDTSGRFGIGTTSPSEKLHLASSSNTTVQVDSFATSSYFNGRQANGTSSAPTATDSGRILVALTGEGYGDTKFPASSTGAIALYSEEAFTDASMKTGIGFFTTPSGSVTRNQTMRITGDGNVGIGTTNPSYRLEVNGSGSTASIMSKSGSASSLAYMGVGRTSREGLIGVASTANDWASGSEAGDIIVRAESSSNKLLLSTGTTAPTVTLSNGSVGIGTTSPSTLLHVSNAGTANILMTNATKSSSIHMRTDTAGTGYINNMNNFVSNGTTGNSQLILTGQGGLIFSYGSSGTSGTPAMAVDTSGRVGIGTISPSYTLHVVGSAGLSTGTAWTNASDARLKDIHGDYEHGLSEVLQLHTVKYSYKQNNPLGLPSNFEKTGFIAQEVQKVIPEAVSERKDGFLELNVDPIHWAVVNAIKELYHKWFNDSEEIHTELSSLHEQVKARDEIIRSLEHRLDVLEKKSIQSEASLKTGCKK